MATTRRRFVALTGMGAGTMLLPGRLGARQEGRRRPNLVVMMADDLSADELACYGHSTHRTPHLDRLAETGVRFETAYSCAICHPTRFQIMTGQYGHNNGVFQFPGRPGGPKPGSDEDNIALKRTFGQILKEGGYATALTGKWQLSGKHPTLIHETGFDEYCMWAYTHNLPEGVAHIGGWEGRRGGKTCRYWAPSIVKNGEYRVPARDDYGPDIFADFAIDFMTRHQDDPFFIYYPMALTHSPYYPTPDTTRGPEDHFKHSKDHWQANVEYCDKIVGRIVAAIDRLGLREDTIVFFTGDNGTGGRGKGQGTERGARVPLIVNGPGRVRPIGTTRELADLSDILPTLCTFSGSPVPTDRPIDGRSFGHILEGRPGPTREWIYSYVGGKRILRDKRWLLENCTMRSPGRFFDCGDCRDGSTYVDVTDSKDPVVLAARARFAAILEGLPAPDVDDAPGKRPRGAGQGVPVAGDWDPDLLAQPKRWTGEFGKPVVSAEGTGLRLAVCPGKRRGVAFIPARYRLPAGATHVLLQVTALSPGANWMLKLAGIRQGGGHFPAHTSDEQTATGTVELPLEATARDPEDAAWIVKLGINGKPGDRVVVESVAFVAE